MNRRAKIVSRPPIFASPLLRIEHEAPGRVWKVTVIGSPLVVTLGPLEAYDIACGLLRSLGMEIVDDGPSE